MRLVILSFKNVLQARRRSLLTFMILIFGVFIYCITTLMLNGLLSLSLQESINQDTAHIRIQKLDRDEDFPYSSTNWFEFNQEINLPEKTYMTTRLFVEAEIDNYDNSLPVPLMGVDPETDFDVFMVPRTDAKATLSPGKVWIGTGLASDMQLSEGDFVNLSFQTKEGTFISAEYEIEAFLTSTLSSISESGVFVNLQDLQQLLGTNMISGVYFRLDDLKKMPQLRDDLIKQFPQFNVEDFNEMLSETKDSIEQRRQIFAIYLVLILVITFLGITNSILISVWEKRRLVGTLRALGQSDHSILLLFLFEGTWIAVLGSLGGVILACLFNIPLSTIGLDMLSMTNAGSNTQFSTGIAIPAVLRTSWDLSAFILPMILVPALSALVSLFPAMKSVQMSIVDSIKNND
ncbi:MAG: ABC transporter permease [Brevinema sp.]